MSEPYSRETVRVTGHPSNLLMDLESVIVRLEQYDEEQDENGYHWILDRVITCDLPRLRAHLAACPTRPPSPSLLLSVLPDTTCGAEP